MILMNIGTIANYAKYVYKSQAYLTIEIKQNNPTKSVTSDKTIMQENDRAPQNYNRI